MAISSIHIETAKPSALIHNERVFSPDYLIVNDKSVNDYKSYTDIHISELENRAKEDYQKYSKNNRKLPSNATLVKEAMINLNENHTINDLEKVKNTLEKEYGYLVTDIAIHRDEGYIETNDKSFIMGRNQFKNFKDTPFIAELDSKDNKFYEWVLNENQEWIRLDEIKEYKINYNYHGHIVMLNYDFSKHGTVRNNLKELSRMQTLVARDLGMERGKCSSTVEAKKIGVQVQESRKRMNIKEYKVQKRKEKELEKALEKEKKKNINLEKELYNFRDTQKEITALTQLSVEDRKALHQLNTMCKQNKITPSELKENIDSLINSYNIQTNELSEKDKLIENLNEKIKYYDNQIAYIDNLLLQVDNLLLEIETKVSQIETLEKANSILIENNEALKKENEDLANENIKLTEIINSRENISDYDVIKKENESLKKENSFLNSTITKIINFANDKIKDLFKFKIYNDVIFKSSDDHFILEEWEDRCNDRYKLETDYNKQVGKELLKFEDFKEEDKKEDNHKSILNGLEKLNKNLDEFVSPEKKKEDLDYSEYHNNLRQP